MGINAAVDGTQVGSYLAHYALRDSEQKRPEPKAHRTCWIYMVDIGRVRANQFKFKTKPLTFAAYYSYLRPQLTKNSVFRSGEL
jgi:hypothetical protein